jgi:hypothetical protein
MFFPVDTLPEGASDQDVPLLTQCTDTESGGHLCEVMLTNPKQPHSHWISDETIRRHTGA